MNRLNFWILFWIVCCSSMESFSQINQVWRTTFENNTYTWMEERTIDKEGNAYLLYSYGSIGDSLMLSKFDVDGINSWNLLVDHDTSASYWLNGAVVFCDSLNRPTVSFMYIDGYDSTYSIIRKYDTDANELWQGSFFPGNNFSYDNNGNFYISNMSFGDMTLFKYDSTGVLLYQTGVPFPNGWFGIQPVFDSMDNAWFYNNVHPAGTYIAKMYRVNSTGIITDSLTLPGALRGMKIDNNDNLIVNYYPLSGNGQDSSRIRKYDAGVNLLWDSGPVAMGLINYMSMGSNGSIFISSTDPANDNIPNELTVGRLDSMGNLNWIHHFGLNGTVQLHEREHLFADPADNVIIVGLKYNDGYTLPSPKTNKFFIKKLNPSGVTMSYEEFEAQDTLYMPVVKNSGSDIHLIAHYSDQFNDIYKFCSSCMNSLSGTVYYDADSSCALDSSEHGLRNAVIKISPGPSYVITDSAGFYHAYLADSVYSLESMPFINFSDACATGPVSVTIDNVTTVPDINFGKYIDPSINDLCVDIGRGRVRPGFNTLFIINYQNKGGSIQSGTLDFVPDPIFNYVSASIPPSFPGGDILRWNFTGLVPGQSMAVHVILNLPSNTPTGSTFTNSTIISGTLPDVSPNNNYFVDQGVVTGSYDPNNKTVIPAGLGAAGYITTNDSILHYTLNFENVGNDTAFTVLVIDTLDSDLDVLSLEIGATSHPCKVDLIHSHILHFRFDNILLPDSATNAEENYGFINYFIKQKTGLPVGTEITNSADIFFDYNLPIRTPQVLNTIVSPTGITDIDPDESVVVYPNPASEVVTVIFNTSQTKIISLIKYNMKGEQVAIWYQIHNGNIVVDISGLSSGIYLLKIITPDGLFHKKVIKM